MDQGPSMALRFGSAAGPGFSVGRLGIRISFSFGSGSLLALSKFGLGGSVFA